MKTTRFTLLLGATLLVTGLSAQAANLKSVLLISHQAKYEWGNAGSQTTRFAAEYEARDQGVDHVCEVRYSVDGWKTSGTATATFDRLVGSYERWKVAIGFPGFRSQVLHVFTCKDLGASYQVYSPSNGMTLTSYGLEISTPVLVVNGGY